MSFVIYHNDKSEYCCKLRDLIEPELSNIYIEEDIAVVIGGDGFFFEMINSLKIGTTFLPLNGGTLGYTLNDLNIDDIDGFISLVRNKKWNSYKFPRLIVVLRNNNNDILLGMGANDICIERDSGQTARLSINTDQISITNAPVICDGLIISTALGSTGYNLSAGGPIIHPGVKASCLTFSNAHIPRIPPIIIPGECEVSISVDNFYKRPIRVVCDGRLIPIEVYKDYIDESELIIKYSAPNFIGNDTNVNVLYLDGHCRTSQLSNKIIKL